MLISQRLPNLLGGVSQRPAPERPLNAVAASTNLLAHPVKGLMTRPGTSHVARCAADAAALDGAQMFPIGGETGERLVLALSGDGKASAIDQVTGRRLIVGTDTYFTGTEGFSVTALAGGGVVVNRGVTVAALSPSIDSGHFTRRAHIFVKATEYDTLYSVTVDAVTVTHTTAATGDISPTSVAEALKVALAAGLGASFLVQRYKSTVFLRRVDVAEFTISGQDSLSNEGMAVIKGFVESIEDLPEATAPLSVLRVAGNPGTNRDDLWVAFQSGTGTEQGYWTEFGSPTATDGWDASTAPKMLRRNNLVLGDTVLAAGSSGNSALFDAFYGVDVFAGKWAVNATDGSYGEITDNDESYLNVVALQGGTTNTFSPGDTIRILDAPGDFTLEDIEWGQRLAGDDTSAPIPSFCGKKIREVFFYRNRLGFLADETVNLSASGDLFRFFRRTMTELLADDPIDVTSAYPGVAPFDGAVEWSGRLVIYSAAGHLFALSGEPALTPSTVRIDHMMAVGTVQDVPPAVFGSRLIVPQQDSGYTRLTEVFYDDVDDGVLDHTDLSAEVPAYATGSPRVLVGSADLGLLCVATTEAACTLYVFQEKWRGNQREMEAWGKWELGTADERVLAMSLVDATLTLLVKRTDGVFVESMDLGAAHRATEECLDRQGHTSEVPFTGSLTFSPFYLRDRNLRPDEGGRLQLRYVTLSHSDTAALEVTIASLGRPSKTYTLSSNPDAPGTYRFPVLSRNTDTTITFSTSGTTGFAIAGVEWEGYFTRRSQGA